MGAKKEMRKAEKYRKEMLERVLEKRRERNDNAMAQPAKAKRDTFVNQGSVQIPKRPDPYIENVLRMKSAAALEALDDDCLGDDDCICDECVGVAKNQLNKPHREDNLPRDSEGRIMLYSLNEIWDECVFNVVRNVAEQGPIGALLDSIALEKQVITNSLNRIGYMQSLIKFVDNTKRK